MARRGEAIGMSGAVLLVRSDNLARDGLRRAIEVERRGDLNVLDEVSDAQSALDAVANRPPVVVLTAAPVPGMPTLSFIAELHARWPGVCIVVILDDLALLTPEELAGLIASGLAGVLLWSDARHSTIDHWLGAALDGVKVHSSAVLAAVLAAQRQPAARPSGPPLRLLLADANEVARRGLHGLLEQDRRFEVAGEAAHDIVSAVRRIKPDVIVLDPASHGQLDLELLADLSREAPSARICVYTSVFDPTSYLAAMFRGPRAYLLKGSDDEILLDVLALVGRSNAVVGCPDATERWAQQGAALPVLSVPERPAWLDRLTPQEYEVLLLIAADLTDTEIGARLHIGAKSAGDHVRHVMDKMGVQTRVRLGLVAHQAGFGTDHPPTRAAHR